MHGFYKENSIKKVQFEDQAFPCSTENREFFNYFALNFLDIMIFFQSYDSIVLNLPTNQQMSDFV